MSSPKMHHTTESKHDPTQLHIQIGIGGAGKEAGLLQLMSNFVTRFAAVFRLLFIDTDKKDVERLPKWMKFLMNDFPAAAFMDELESNPDQIPGSGLTDRVPQYRLGLGGSESITAGLQTFRQLGWPLLTFYLCRYAAEFFYFLLAPLQELHAYVANLCNRQGQGNIQDRLRLMVTIVFSSCGGTGSSLGLLVANLLHYLLPHRGGFTRYSIDADILLPGPMTHKAVNIGLLLANSHASLSEVQTSYATPHQPLPDIQLGPLSLPRRQPFTQMYLYDGINLGGYTFKDRRQVCEVRNAVYELRNFGVEGAEYRSRLADIHFQYPRIFSAAGACILEYDAEHHIADLGYRTESEHLAKLTMHLPEGIAKEQTQDQVRTFLHNHPGFLQIPAFAADGSGKPLRISLQSLRRQPHNQLMPLLNHHLKRVQQHWHASLDGLTAAALDERRQQVIKTIESLLATDGGFFIAQAVLAALSDQIQQQRAVYQTEVERCREQVKKSKRKAQAKPTGLMRWWPLGVSKRLLTSQQHLLDASLNFLRHQARLTVLEQLLAELGLLEEARINFLATLNAFAELVSGAHRAYMETHEKQRSIAIQSVVCPDQVDSWYTNGKSNAIGFAQQQLKPVWMPDQKRFGLEQMVTKEEKGSCLILSDEGLDRHFALCKEPWQYLAEKSIEEILLAQGRTAEDVYADLESAAAPLVSLAEVRQIPAAHRLLVLASETPHFFADLPAQTGLSVIPTSNRRRISLLYTIHGLALEHLMKAHDFRTAYENALAEGRNLHVYPDAGEVGSPARRKRRGAKAASSNPPSES